MGVNHSVQGTETVTLLNTLCLITGNVGRAGRGALLHHRPVQRHGHPGGGGDGVAARLPGVGLGRPTGPSWPACGAVPVERLPTERGRAYPDIIDGVLDGTIKGLWIIATNPPVSFPNRGRLERALAQPRPARGAGRVRDAHHRPGPRGAARRHLGREGRHLHQRRAAGVAGAQGGGAAGRWPGPTSTSSWPWPRRWACATSCTPGWTGPEDAFTEWARVSAGRLCDYSGITWDTHRRRRRRAVAVPARHRDGGGSPRLYDRRRVPDADGQGQAVVRLARAHRRRPQRPVPVPAQHRPHRRALAHPHQDGPGRRPRAPGPRGVGGGQPGRRRAPRRRRRRPGAAGVPPGRRRGRAGPGHRHRARGRGVRALPLRRAAASTASPSTSSTPSRASPTTSSPQSTSNRCSRLRLSPGAPTGRCRRRRWPARGSSAGTGPSRAPGRHP